MSDREERPPQAPDIERRLQLQRYQWIGLPLLMLIPVLALLGIFDERRSTAIGSDAVLELRVDHPTRHRHPQVSHLEVQVRNLAAQPLEVVVVSFDSAYLAGYTRIDLMPSPQQPYRVELRDLRPGEARRVRLEAEGERYGRHRGEIVASAGASEVRVQVSTFLIP